MDLRIKRVVMTKNGNQFDVMLPAKRIVCPECEGSGRTLCAGLRGVAFSSEEMCEDADFAESYFRGDYDVKCDCCNGENVILVVDCERISQKMLERLARQQDHEISCRMDGLSERRRGA